MLPGSFKNMVVFYGSDVTNTSKLLDLLISSKPPSDAETLIS